MDVVVDEGLAREPTFVFAHEDLPMDHDHHPCHGSSMNTCARCRRHLRTSDDVCPFCATRRTGKTFAAVALASTMTVAMSGCYGAPYPYDDGTDSWTESSGESGDSSQPTGTGTDTDTDTNTGTDTDTGTDSGTDSGTDTGTGTDG